MPKSFILTYWKTITLCILIFVISSVTFSTIPDVAKFKNNDKVTHVLMYAALGFIACYEYLKDKNFRVKYKYWLFSIFLFLIFFGGIIEILQGTLFYPRTSESMDWVADIFGLIIGFTLAKLVLKKR